MNFRIDPELHRWYRELVAGTPFKHLSDAFREALIEYKALYTGEPTMISLDQKARRHGARLDQIDKKIRELNRVIAEMKR